MEIEKPQYISKPNLKTFKIVSFVCIILSFLSNRSLTSWMGNDLINNNILSVIFYVYTLHLLAEYVDNFELKHIKVILYLIAACLAVNLLKMNIILGLININFLMLIHLMVSLADLARIILSVVVGVMLIKAPVDYVGGLSLLGKMFILFGVTMLAAVLYVVYMQLILDESPDDSLAQIINIPGSIAYTLIPFVIFHIARQAKKYNEQKDNNTTQID